MTDWPQDAQAALSLARWRSRRGMLELDFFLVDFVAQVVPTLDASAQQVYYRLLACEDVELHGWLTGDGAPEDVELRGMVEQIRKHAAERPA